MNNQLKSMLVKAQKNEMIGEVVYRYLGQVAKDDQTRQVLIEIADNEKTHYETFQRFTGVVTKPNAFIVRLIVLFISILVKVLGLTFVLKLFERLEARQIDWTILEKDAPEVYDFIKDEEGHEKLLLDAINEESLNYMGSVVLGLNDALVELTGALAGFTLSIQDSRTIGLIGLITGISASFSMAASEFLSSREEEVADVDAKKASLYTGLAYVFTVIFLVTPFFIISNYLLAMTVTLLVGIIIIAFFNYYVSVTKDEPFKRRFLEMTLISLGVASISFVIGFVVKNFIGIDI